MKKLYTSKVFVKFGSEGKFRDVNEVTVNGFTIEEMFSTMEQTKQAFQDLMTELQGHYVVEEEASYIVEIEGKLYRTKLNVLKDENTTMPLTFYKLENGKIVIDKKKVGAL
jgi:hypothetical protein